MKNLFYILKVWFLTSVLTPTFYSIYFVIVDGLSHYDIDDLDIILISIAFGLALSAPTFIVMGIVYSFIKDRLKTLYQIVVLMLLGTIGTFLTFYILDSESFGKFDEGLLFPGIYALMLVALVVILYPKRKAEEVI